MTPLKVIRYLSVHASLTLTMLFAFLAPTPKTFEQILVLVRFEMVNDDRAVCDRRHIRPRVNVVVSAILHHENPQRLAEGVGVAVGR